MKTSRRIWFVYLGGFFLTIHYATIVYINSSLLGQFTKDSTVSVLYVVGSILSIVALAFAPLFLRRFGNINTLLFFVALEIFAVFGMGSSTAGLLVFLLFILHQAAESMLNFSLDISLEHEVKLENTTGGKRSFFLTAQNIAWVLSPLFLSFLVDQNDFSNVYLISSLALIPLFIIGILILPKIKSTEEGSHLPTAIKSLKYNWNETKILGAQFVLQFYFSWMVIYLPLMLYKQIGFSWKEIGLLLIIMLIPYILFEIPTGLLADKKFGEKEILATGFVVIALTTFLIPFISLPTFWLWATILFGTRVGASMVEIASESYFFKHVKEKDSSLISLFRMTRPVSQIFAPLIALPIIIFYSYSTSFLVLALITTSGLLFIPKKDTK